MRHEKQQQRFQKGPNSLLGHPGCVYVWVMSTALQLLGQIVAGAVKSLCRRLSQLGSGLYVAEHSLTLSPFFLYVESGIHFACHSWLATCEVGSARASAAPFLFFLFFFLFCLLSVIAGISSLPAAVAAVIYSINLCVKLLLLFRHLLLLPPPSSLLDSLSLLLCEFNVTSLCWLGES